MPALNKVMLMGNLTRDPELRYTPKGTAVTDIGLAINRRIKEETTTREEVIFVDITFFGRQAEVVCQYLKKGNPLYVEGRLHMDTWTDTQSGQKKTRTKVIAEEMQFLGSAPARNGESANTAPPPAARQPATMAAAAHARSAPGTPGSALDDEIEF